MENEPPPSDSPATLVAIIFAAHKVGDRELELEMRERLKERYGIKLVFSRRRTPESVVPDAR